MFLKFYRISDIEKNNMGLDDLGKYIFYIDIGKTINQDIAEWRLPGRQRFTLDINSARNHSVEKVFQHMETKDRKVAYIRVSDITFTIAANPEIQFQMLETVLEEVIRVFQENFADLPEEMLLQGAAQGIFSLIDDIFHFALKDGVKWITTFCHTCRKNVKVCVKKALITKSPRYPVSLVYLHHGHGLLIYIDRDFAVRGTELVDLTS